MRTKFIKVDISGLKMYTPESGLVQSPCQVILTQTVKLGKEGKWANLSFK